MILYFLKNFNNYYNRIIKRCNTVDDYISNSDDYAVRGTEQILGGHGTVNFNIADGVSTDITYNYDDNQSWQPDYVVVCEEDGETIASTWFVLEAARTRKNQYRINVRRDLINDNFEAIMASPMFIEKAMLPSSDPMIFNKEDMVFNQIKKNEQLITDKTKCAWIVGYIAEDFSEDITVSETINQDYDFAYDTVEDFPYYDYLIRGNYRPTYLVDDYENNATVTFKYTRNELEIEEIYNFNGNEFQLGNENANVNTLFYLNKINMTSFKNNVRAAAGNNAHTVQEFQDFSATKFYQYKIDNIIYKCKQNDTGTSTVAINVPAFSNLYDQLIASTIVDGIQRNNLRFVINKSFSRHNLQLEALSGSISFTIPANAPKLKDAPYKMFCIPFRVDGQNPSFNQVNSLNIDFDTSLKIAAALCKKTVGSNPLLYDLQLLPYCPVIDNIAIDFNNLITSSIAWNGVTDISSNSNKNIILWATQSSFTIRDFSITTPRTELKIRNQTDFIRLCSPNYNGLFDFNYAQNGGGYVTNLNIECTYKPFQPYIHVCPQFDRNYLFGGDYHDARGLICAGDFSLPQTSSAWETYQRNNANYQNSFDRDVQNLELTQNIAMNQMKWQVAAGTIGAAASSATIGAGVGGIAGGIAGGLIAGGASLAAGLADIGYQKQLNEEAIDYRKDQFGFALGNIKALPNSLSRVSSFTYNNKIFPFAEYYSCTDVEKEAFRAKIKYNGMTVGRINKISDIIKNGMYDNDYGYIKGKLIRLEHSGDDYHNLNEIANELYKGVFIKNDTE